MSHPAPQALAARDLTVAYGTNPALLRGLEFEAARAEHVAIVGASGTGKTTLLRVLAGTQTAGQGEVVRVGRVASVHQDLRLVPQSSALANVLHGALGNTGLISGAVGFPRETRRQAQAWLTRVGLAGKERLAVRKLSGGEQQRVAIARALMHAPAILLADEPVASLDGHNAARVLELLTRLCREEGVTLVSVLHQRDLAERYADRVLELRDGLLVPCCAQASAVDRAASRGTHREHDSPAQAAPTSCPDEPSDGLEARLLGGRPWRFALLAGAALALYGWSLAGLEIEGRQLADAPRNLLRFATSFVPRSSAALAALPWTDILRGLRETLQMSLLATTAGVLGALPLAVLAARNLSPPWLSASTRQVLNFVRTVPSILWAMLFVAAVGLGPFAGILALVCYTLGYLTKFFYEAFEGVGRPTQDALRELGASGPQRFVHAVWPAALPAFLSSSLFMLEYNVRSASILGVVDAGGIGVQLHELMIYRNFPGAAVCLLLVLAVVIVLDALSSRVRDWAVRR